MEALKQRLLGGVTGRVLSSVRDTFTIVCAALGRSESLGTLLNDQLATSLVARLCLPNKIFVDVGAHIGSIVAAVVDNDSSIRIVAIEAIPEKVIRLRKKFPLATIHECAVSEYEGEASFFVDLQRSGYSSLSTKETRAGSATREIRVKVCRLDQLVVSGDVDIIKIDVEGAELGVLKGAQGLLQQSRPIVMFESGPEERLSYTKAALWQYLSAQKYAIVVPNRLAHLDDGLSLEGFVESHLYPRRTTNYFAVPTERRHDVRDRARKLLGLR